MNIDINKGDLEVTYDSKFSSFANDNVYMHFWKFDFSGKWGAEVVCHFKIDDDGYLTFISDGCVDSLFEIVVVKNGFIIEDIQSQILDKSGCLDGNDVQNALDKISKLK